MRAIAIAASVFTLVILAIPVPSDLEPTQAKRQTPSTVPGARLPVAPVARVAGMVPAGRSEAARAPS